MSWRTTGKRKRNGQEANMEYRSQLLTVYIAGNKAEMNCARGQAMDASDDHPLFSLVAPDAGDILMKYPERGVGKQYGW